MNGLSLHRQRVDLRPVRRPTNHQFHHQMSVHAEYRLRQPR